MSKNSKRPREVEDIKERVERAVENYKKGAGDNKDLLKHVICTGIVGFYKTSERLRFVANFKDEEGKEAQLTFGRPSQLLPGCHSPTEFFKMANTWPKLFAIVGTWDADFVPKGSTGESRQAVLNFSAKVVIRPVEMCEEDQQCVFEFGHPIGTQPHAGFGFKGTPAWKVKVIKVMDRQGEGRVVMVEHDGFIHEVTQYQVKTYDQQILVAGDMYLVIGLKTYKTGLANGSCCQFIPESTFEKEMWDSFGGSIKQAYTTEDCM